MVKVVIKGANSEHRLNQIEEVVGKHRVYLQGTFPDLLCDFARREWADLAVVNLNLIPGVKAEILDPRAGNA